jgi:Asp-tRNA(Asn)/Glu-tRNA(Gln) amidotransferase A subunit family amidase
VPAAKNGSDLYYLSAVEALALFRARKLSPVELMAATIARAEAVEPTVNAFTHRFFDAAMESARKAEARYAGKGPRPRPLEGIPLAIKEEMPVAGQPNSSASLIFKDHIADHTSPLAERMLRAGAIVHARTTQPEFACTGFTHSRLFGVTRNPWNPAFDVGGSSGGAAASLAAGTTTLAGGSDIGGSIRIPASCCGVVGFKPPYGRVPQDPPFNLDHYCHEGPLARTVADCALFQNTISGPHPNDIASVRQRVRVPTDRESAGDVKGRRIAVSVRLGNFEVDDDVARNTLAAADAFREAGAIVEEVELGWDREEIFRTGMIHLRTIFGNAIGQLAAEHRDLMTPYALKFADEAATVPPGAYFEGLEAEGRTYTALSAVLERYDVLICPTIALPALAAGDDYVDHGPIVNGKELPTSYHHLMTIPFNICSRCPVLSVPSGFSRDGVPTGLQIVGRTFEDASVFRAAYAFEQVRPWMDAPERRPRARL